MTTKRFRVYYTIPAYAYKEVSAESEEQAKQIALDGDDDDLSDYRIDWDSTGEYAYTMEIP